MEFKHSPDDELVPKGSDGFVPIDQVADTALIPDQALMEKEEKPPETEPGDETTLRGEGTEDGDDDPTPQAWETHPAMEGVPYVTPNLGSEVSDLGAGAQEELDRKSLLEKLREWWSKDMKVYDDQSHVPKRERPKGAETIRGAGDAPADDAPVDKMDEAA